MRAAAFLVLTVGLAASPATAQQFLSPNTAPLAGYEAPGMTSGEFLIKQSVTTGLAYDSNILLSSSHAIQDFIFFVSPTVDITRDAGKNIQELLVSMTSAKYFKSSADDYTDVYTKARETYLLSNTSQIDLKTSFSDGYQRRIATNFQIPTNAAAPVHEQIFLASIGYKQIGKNYDAGVTVTSSAERFNDVLSTSGFLIDQTYRNENDLLVDSFININLAPWIKSGLVVQGSDIGYKETAMNFTQWRAAETLTFDLTSKTHIALLAGVRQQDLYNVPGFPASLLYEYEGRIDWQPRQTVSFQVKAGYRDFGVDYLLGVTSGGFDPYYAFSANYLMWRNLNLNTGVAFETRHLKSANPEVDYVLNSNAAITYEFSSYAGVSLLYNFQEWSSHVQTSNFRENIFQTSLNLRF